MNSSKLWLIGQKLALLVKTWHQGFFCFNHHMIDVILELKLIILLLSFLRIIDDELQSHVFPVIS